MKEIKLSNPKSLHKYIDFLHKESSVIRQEYNEGKHSSLVEIMQIENPDRELLFELEVIQIAKTRLSKTGNDFFDVNPQPNIPDSH